MGSYSEDIFSDYNINLLLRFNNNTISEFDKENSKNVVKFRNIVDILNNKERKCVFSKFNDNEHKISIFMPEPAFGGTLEIIAEWDASRNSYLIKVKSRKKTKFNILNTSIDPKYAIEKTCVLRFLSMSEGFYSDYDTTRELTDLYKQVNNLEVAPATKIENERDLWTKFIEAQQLKIEKSQEPFECNGDVTLEKNKKGYQLKLTVPIKTSTPKNVFDELIDEYKRAFNENITINLDTGSSFLTKKQIEDLNIVLQRKFNGIYERENEITCILKIRPLNIVECLQSETKNLRIWVDSENGYLAIGSSETFVPQIPKCVQEKYNLKIIGVYCKYIKENEFGISINKIERVIPPSINSIRYVHTLTEDMHKQAEALKNGWLDSQEYRKVQYYIGCYYSYTYSVNEFNEEIISKIQREIYELGYKYNAEESNLSFEFSSFDEMEKKVQVLCNLRSFKLTYNPLTTNDFGFKVRFKYLKAKIKSQLERIKELKNLVFAATFSNNPHVKPIYIGTLNGFESTERKLVFNIPFRHPEEKVMAGTLLKYLKKAKTFINVHANLKGDETKINWLKEAVDKLSESRQTSGQPNSKPVNPRIRDFIFDSAKAEPTYKFELKDIEDTEEYRTVKRRQLLKLNESQLKSVIKALYAKDMCLLQGPPGTGKTTVIAELIWQHIINNSLKRVLVTSETNLAVDNALEKLMNGRNVSEELTKYLHIIKPLRFGSALKFEEEGKRFSVERIEKWLDDEYEDEFVYENELSSFEDANEASEEEIINEEEQEDNLSANAVQDWMDSIVNRTMSNNDKYKDVLSEFKEELSNPSGITKRYFKDKYFKYANVIGSTCSSTGSPAFAMDFALINSSDRFEEYKNENYKNTISDIRSLIITASDEEHSFSSNANRIIKSIIKENNIDYVDLEELLDNPTMNFKHFLFEYDFKLLLKESAKEISTKRFEILMKRLCFKSKEEFNRLLNISFNTVIMDEASKATPPDLVLPLSFGEKSVIIGDHRQLPPMLYDKTFKEALLELDDKRATELSNELEKGFTETSQFSRLIQNPKVSPTIKSVFTDQYRMHPQINDVISQFYEKDEGGLHCGLDLGKVDSTDLGDPESRYHGFYHPGFISSDVHTLWVNVDEPEMRSDSKALYNDAEVEAVKRVLLYLKNSEGFKEYMSYWDNSIKDINKRNAEKEIGVISFYAKQVRQLREVKKLARDLGMRIKLNTVDKFQGMERNIVIVSTVRSNKKYNNGKIEKNGDPGFAKSPERLNVALSRARRLLIVVGNSDFFSEVKDKDGNYLYRNVINEMQKHSEIINYKSLSKYTNDEKY